MLHEEVKLFKKRFVIGTDIYGNDFTLDLWTGLLGAEEIEEFDALDKETQEEILACGLYAPTVKEHLAYLKKVVA